MAALALGVPGAGGCAFRGGVNPNHFKYESRVYDGPIRERALIEMPKAVQYEKFIGKPSSLTGAETNLTLPIGEITREAATLAFGNIFSDGVKLVESPSGQMGHVAVIRPLVTQFSYEYNALRNASFAITLTAVVDLELALAGSTGKLLLHAQLSVRQRRRAHLLPERQPGRRSLEGRPPGREGAAGRRRYDAPGAEERIACRGKGRKRLVTRVGQGSSLESPAQEWCQGLHPGHPRQDESGLPG